MDYDYDYAEFLWMEEVGQVFRFFFPFFFFSFLSEWRKQVFKFERGNNVRESITYRFLIGKIFSPDFQRVCNRTSIHYCQQHLRV